jgi:CDP-diacylglycerol--glycerol-3-phosphate 3-phosphatidyltransferase
MKRITPNGITMARIGLIPVFVATLLTSVQHERATVLAFAVFAVAALTDGIDGYLARSRGLVTTMGIFLDPLADKLLITSALVALVELNEIAAWVVLIILSREFAVTGLRAVAASEGVIVPAGWSGKLKTTAQIALVLALIPPDSPEWLGDWLTWIVVVVTIGSAIEYFWHARHLLRSTPATPAGHESPL